MSIFHFIALILLMSYSASCSQYKPPDVVVTTDDYGNDDCDTGAITEKLKELGDEARKAPYTRKALENYLKKRLENISYEWIEGRYIPRREKTLLRELKKVKHAVTSPFCRRYTNRAFRQFFADLLENLEMYYTWQKRNFHRRKRRKKQ